MNLLERGVVWTQEFQGLWDGRHAAGTAADQRAQLLECGQVQFHVRFLQPHDQHFQFRLQLHILLAQLLLRHLLLLLLIILLVAGRGVWHSFRLCFVFVGERF